MKEIAHPEMVSSKWQPIYDVVSGGNMDLSGQANFGSVHTNSNFNGSGQAKVKKGSYSGTGKTSGQFKVTDPPKKLKVEAPVTIPVIDMSAFTPDTVYCLPGSLSLAGQGDGGLANLINADGVAGRRSSTSTAT